MPALTYHHLFERAQDPLAPPLLLLHGTGGDEHDLVRIGRALSPKSALLSPRGDVSEGGAKRFFARLAEGVFEPAEIIRRTHALADFIAAATKHYGLDQTRLIAVGFSNGANIAATLLQLRPESIAQAVLLRAMAVLEQPAVPGSLNGKRVLLINGSFDPIVPAADAIRLRGLLEAGGAAVTSRIISASHALTASDVPAAHEWLES
ncbi:MAG: alpha/beta hydrolase [Opitutaceae bacterium]